MNKIRVALAGVGNCASSLVQGLEYYKGRNKEAFTGLMHARIGDWGPSDPLAVPKCRRELASRGHHADTIHTISYANPLEFLSKSGRFSVT